MIFEQRPPFKRLGWVSGYVAAYLIFTTVLFFMLTLLKKLPDSWPYTHIVVITSLVGLLGAGVRRLLK